MTDIIHTITTLIMRTTNAVSEKDSKAIINECRQPKVIFPSEAFLQEFLGTDVHHHLCPYL